MRWRTIRNDVIFHVTTHRRGFIWLGFIVVLFPVKRKLLVRKRYGFIHFLFFSDRIFGYCRCAPTLIYKPYSQNILFTVSLHRIHNAFTLVEMFEFKTGSDRRDRYTKVRRKFEVSTTLQSSNNNYTVVPYRTDHVWTKKKKKFTVHPFRISHGTV